MTSTGSINGPVDRDSERPADALIPPSPYMGLLPYRQEDAPFFFGREAEREVITANLMASRLTILYGPSGVGKTSVLNAGVAHYLRLLTHRNTESRGTPEFAVVVFDSWRDDPVSDLLAIVSNTVFETLNRPVEPSIPVLPLATGLRYLAERVGGHLFVILDQFEEYFLYRRGEEEKGGWAHEFPLAVASPDLPVNFLISVREDALSKLDDFKGPIPNPFENRLRLDRLDLDSARQAIELPLEKYNLVTQPRLGNFQIEPALVEAVLEQVQTGHVAAGRERDPTRRSGDGWAVDGRIETPYLQLVMMRLWEEEIERGSRVLRRETLSRLGEAEKIIGSHLDNIMNGLTADEREVAARAFHYLVTPSGTKIAHAAGDLAEWGGTPMDKVTSLLSKLADPKLRIMRTVPSAANHSSRRFEIFHDALVPAVLDWRHRYIESRAAHRRHRWWWLVSAVVAMLLGLGVWTVAQTRSIIERPDLIVAELSRGTLVIGNVGKSASGRFMVQLGETEQLIGQLKQDQEVTLPFACINGAVEVIVDPDDEVPESNEDNNTRREQMRCPDLTAVESASGTLLVKNVGPARAGPFIVLVGKVPVTVTGLGSGHDISIETRTACQAEPTRQVFIEVDSKDMIAELDELNNNLPLSCGPR